MREQNAVAKRRIRRATLRGWWLGLPLVVPLFSVLFSFAWFETQRMNNEFIAGELAESVREVNERNASLEREIQRLRNLDRLSEKASAFSLHEASPGQRIVLRPSATTMKTLHAHQMRPVETTVLTRVVLIRWDDDSRIDEAALKTDTGRRLAFRLDGP